jgi:NAD-dependent DNA ligase
LGIRHVGLETAALIASKFGTFDAFWKYLQAEAERMKTNAEKHTEKVQEEKGGLEVPMEGMTVSEMALTGTKIESIIEDKADPICPDIIGLKGIGTKVVRALMEFVIEPCNQAVVSGLMQELHIAPARLIPSPKSAEEIDNSVNDGNKSSDSLKAEPASELPILPLHGKKVVFTGKLSLMARSAAQEACLRLGRYYHIMHF